MISMDIDDFFNFVQANAKKPTRLVISFAVLAQLDDQRKLSKEIAQEIVDISKKLKKNFSIYYDQSESTEMVEALWQKILKKLDLELSGANLSLSHSGKPMTWHSKEWGIAAIIGQSETDSIFDQT